MKKQKSLNNKGFSLVELIIVIAIMAILTGVLAPNFIRYLSRANESADIQLLDNIRSVFTTTLMDPQLLEDAGRTAVLSTEAGGVGGVVVLTGTGANMPTTGNFGVAIAQQLGFTNIAGMTTGLASDIRSNDGDNSSAITVNINAQGVVTSVTMDQCAGGFQSATGATATTPNTSGKDGWLFVN